MEVELSGEKFIESKRVFVLYFYFKKEKKQFIWLHQVPDAARGILSCSTQGSSAGEESASVQETRLPFLGWEDALEKG